MNRTESLSIKGYGSVKGYNKSLIKLELELLVSRHWILWESQDGIPSLPCLPHSRG